MCRYVQLHRNITESDYSDCYQLTSVYLNAAHFIFKFRLLCLYISWNLFQLSYDSLALECLDFTQCKHSPKNSRKYFSQSVSWWLIELCVERAISLITEWKHNETIFSLASNIDMKVNTHPKLTRKDIIENIKPQRRVCYVSHFFA